MRISLHLLVALVLSRNDAGASRWTSYTPEDGLPGLGVHDLLQSPDGSMWAATRLGLARLDPRPGRHWEQVESGDWRVLAIDRHDVIWAGGPNGQIGWYAPDGAALETPERLRNLDGEEILDLVTAPDGTMFIGTASSLWFWNPDVSLSPPELLVAGWTRALTVDPQGRLWYGTETGEVICNGAGCPQALSPLDDPISSILATSDGLLVVGATDGQARVIVLSDQSIVHLPLPATGEGQAPPIEDSIEDALGRVWIARGAVHRFDRSDQPADPSLWEAEVFSAEDGLSGDEVRSILETHPVSQGKDVPSHARQMWFATDQGISVQSGLPWVSFHTRDGALGADQCSNLWALGNCNTVQQIAFDPSEDVIWFASLETGLSRLENGDSWTYWVNEGFLGGPLVALDVRALHVDSDGSAWVASWNSSGTDGGLQVFDRRGGLRRTVGRSANRWLVSGLGRDTSGHLWLATRDGAWRLDTSTDPAVETHFNEATGLPYALLDALAVGERAVFVAASEGLARFDLDSEEWAVLPFAQAGLSASVTVRDLLVRGSRIYATTSEGLLIADANTTTLSSARVLGPQDGLDGAMFGLAPAHDEGVWIATQTGLRRAVPPDWQLGRVTVLDGLPEDDVVAVAVRGDETWIGTRGDGAAAHRFEVPETAILKPPAAVITQAGHAVLMSVAASDLDSRPETILFELRVDDGPWQIQSGSTVSFVPAALGLSDGAHVVSVRAVDEARLSDRTPASATFELDTVAPIPTIQSPANGQAIAGLVEIRATTTDPRFKRHSVELWRDRLTEEDAEVLDTASDGPVNDTVLSVWDTGLHPDDWYTLQIVVEDTMGVSGVDRIRVQVDNEEPFADVTSPLSVTGDAGGVVYSPAGEASLLLPPFCFQGEETVMLNAVSVPTAAGEIGFLLEPESLELKGRATLQIRTAGDPGDMAVYQRRADDWVRLGGTRQSGTDGVTYRVGIDQFGLYALLPDAGEPNPLPTVISGLRTDPRLFQPRAGPTEGLLSVSFDLARPSSVSAIVYNRAGRPRRVLAERRELSAGRQVLTWDGRDESGELVAAGLYVMCVEAGEERVVKVFSVGAR